MILATSCEKDQDVVSSDLIIQNENISSFYKCAIIESELESKATLSNIFIEYSILDKNDYQQIEIKKIADKYYAVITNLIPNSSYKYQYNASNRFSSKTVETNSIFTTLPNTSIPAVLTDTASKITKSSATVQGYVIDDGGENITEFGVVYATSSFPTIDDQKVSLTNANWDFTVTLTDLNAETNYYVRTYAINNKGVSYGNQITFTTSDNREYIDLGLSVKWATFNVGARSIEEYGNHYAWGEVEPKTVYSWDTYTKSDYYISGTKFFLDSCDDAAAVNWGGTWRMPTREEIEELRRDCNWSPTTIDGTNGYMVTSRNNGESIFMPAYANFNFSAINSEIYCYYWSNERRRTDQAYVLYFGSTRGEMSLPRYIGLPIRPVCP